jgi:ribosomal protein S18 acetylase RimI-like enzyme
VVPPEWLSRCLAARGYVLAAEIVNYRLRRPCPGVLGNADVLVRQAELADQDAMLAVDRDAFVPLWRYPASQMADNLAACRQRLVAVEGGAVIGYLLAAQQGDHLHINRVAVHPIWQGRGVGLRLMTTALDTAYRDGVAAVTLNTQADNRASRRLYEQLGFTAAPQQLPFWTHDLFTVNDKDSVTELQPH